MTIYRAATTVLLFSVAALGQGRRGILNATPAQTAALARMNVAIAPQTQRLAAARADLLAAALSQPADDAVIRERVGAIRTAELELAKALATAFAELQSSINKLTDGQIATLAAGSVGGAGRGGYRTSMPHVTAKQANGSLTIQPEMFIIFPPAVRLTREYL